MDETAADDALLTPAEVARLFRVSPKTVTRWARSGKLTAMKTLGGHRRFRAGEVLNALTGAEEQLDSRQSTSGRAADPERLDGFGRQVDQDDPIVAGVGHHETPVGEDVEASRLQQALDGQRPQLAVHP